MDVSIVIVSYNVADFLLACIASIKKETACKYEIIVVDNNSQDDSVKRLQKGHSDVVLIRNQGNVGFVKANNQAFQISGGRYVFMLNPDTLILDKAIDKLVQFMDEHPECGGGGPKNLNPDMSLQPNCHHFPTIFMRLIEHAGLNERYPDVRLFGKKDMTYWSYDETKDVDWITGCSLMLRRKALEKVGNLDENYFMYSEETDICYQLKKAGWKILFCPSASIIHYGGKSSTSQTVEKQYFGTVIKHLYKSKYFFFKKNYSNVHCFVLKTIDFIYYFLYYIRNLFRMDLKARKYKLTYASSILSIILEG